MANYGVGIGAFYPSATATPVVMREDVPAAQLADAQPSSADIDEIMRRLQEEDRRRQEEIERANEERLRSQSYTQPPSAGGIGQFSGMIPPMGGGEAAGASAGGAEAAAGGSAAGGGGAGASSGAGSALAAAGPWAAMAAAIGVHHMWAKNKGMHDNQDALLGRAFYKDADWYQPRLNEKVDGLGDEAKLASLGSSPVDLFRADTWKSAAKLAAKGGIIGSALKKLF